MPHIYEFKTVIFVLGKNSGLASRIPMSMSDVHVCVIFTTGKTGKQKEMKHDTCLSLQPQTGIV